MESDAWSAPEPPAPHAGDGGAVDPAAADARLHTEVRSSAGGGEARAADRWLRGGRREPTRARRELEERAQIDPLSGELYTLLGQRSHPRAKQGFERALIVAHERGEWQVRFFVGGEGNAAWLRRGL